MLSTLLSVFAVIFVAELPDKTALASLVLATRHKPAPVWLGASLALTVQSIVAVAAGSLFALLPTRVVHIASGVAFLVSAFFMWRREDEDETPEEGGASLGFWRILWTTFGVVFIAEWGDLTQIGTAALAARFRAPFTVFLGATAALWAVSGLAVFLGNRLGALFKPELTQRVAAVVFVFIGATLVAGVL